MRKLLARPIGCWRQAPLPEAVFFLEEQGLDNSQEGKTGDSVLAKQKPRSGSNATTSFTSMNVFIHLCEWELAIICQNNN